jgi:hypothetical protein
VVKGEIGMMLDMRVENRHSTLLNVRRAEVKVPLYVKEYRNRV